MPEDGSFQSSTERLNIFLINFFSIHLSDIDLLELQS